MDVPPDSDSAQKKIVVCAEEDVPEIDHTDPFHNRKREKSFQQDAQPSYDLLADDVAELNVSLFTMLKDGTAEDVVDGNEADGNQNSGTETGNCGKAGADGVEELKGENGVNQKR